jgi:replicative DNA helicase
MNSLPNSAELEQQMIGQCLVDGKVASTILQPNDFYSPIWRQCWAAIQELDDEGREIEPFGVAEKVRSRKMTVETSVIVNSTYGLVSTHSTDKWVEQLRNYSTRRYLMLELSKQIDHLQNESDVSECLDRLENRIDVVRTEMVSKDEGFVPLSRVIDEEVLPALAQLRDGKTEKIATGFEVLDHAIGGGIGVSDVAIVAGLPGGGKSAFVLQMAAQIAKRGTPIAFLSGEMTNKENGLRLVSQAADFINLNSICHLYQEQYTNLYDWAVSLKGLPMYIDHKTCDLQTMGSHLKALVRRKGVKVLFVDYIQLMKLQRIDKRTRHERVTEASQEMKRIANELDISVVEVAQFNREGAKSGKAGMFDLEASGQLEKDTSLIFVIDRSETQPEEITVRIVKGRNTGKAEIKGRFKGETLKFSF